MTFLCSMLHLWGECSSVNAYVFLAVMLVFHVSRFTFKRHFISSLTKEEEVRLRAMLLSESVIANSHSSFRRDLISIAWTSVYSNIANRLDF